tara:strand:- start:16417 stop:16728 length:312 start_codon:yes stop_codon:yes gene_type:complete
MSKLDAIQQKIDKLEAAKKEAKKADIARERAEKVRREADMEKRVLRAAKRSGLFKVDLTSSEIEEAMRELVAANDSTPEAKTEEVQTTHSQSFDGGFNSQNYS